MPFFSGALSGNKYPSADAAFCQDAHDVGRPRAAAQRRIASSKSKASLVTSLRICGSNRSSPSSVGCAAGETANAGPPAGVRSGSPAVGPCAAAEDAATAMVCGMILAVGSTLPAAIALRRSPVVLRVDILNTYACDQADTHTPSVLQRPVRWQTLLFRLALLKLSAIRCGASLRLREPAASPRAAAHS